MNTEFPVLFTEKEILLKIAKDIKAIRVKMNLTQMELSNRSGVSHGTLKKFEQSGQISLKNLVKLAFVLNKNDELASIFETKIIPDLFMLENKPERKRARHKGN
ncbi:MAG: helix-turn-helix domain-containing protein [Leptospirillum sp.]|jgi:transcriptional regulator with XRE-family HTH domain